MIISKNEQRVDVRSNLAGGIGETTMVHFLNKEDSFGTGSLFAVLTLQPGCSIGYHKHEGEFEVYYMLEGTAEVMDEGEIYQLHPGDMMQCNPGGSHSIINKSEGIVRFLAFILNV